MKAGFLLVTALVLAVLCLGSASHATAQSVTGGGTIIFDTPPPLVINVSARSEAGGSAGIIHISQRNLFAIGQVVDLCVVGNEAIVVAQITHSETPGLPTGDFLPLFFQDNGNTGDAVNFVVSLPQRPPSCQALFSDPDLTDGTPLTHGNINVTP